MAAEVLCGRCGALLTNPNAPCPRCGAPASGSYYRPSAAQRKSPWAAEGIWVVVGVHDGDGLEGAGVSVVGVVVGVEVGKAVAGADLRGRVDHGRGYGPRFQLFDLGLDASVIGLSLGVPLELGPGALYVFSIVDAYRTAKHMESTGA